VTFEIRLRGFLGAPAGCQARKFAYDERLNVWTRGFLIVSIRADISNVRVGEADDLSGIAWIGENFLISGEAGIENGLPAPASFCSGGASKKNSPVFQRKSSGLSSLMGQRILLNSIG